MIVPFDTDLPYGGKRYLVENRVITDSKGKKLYPCMAKDKYIGTVYCGGRTLRGKKNESLIQQLLQKAAEALFKA